MKYLVETLGDYALHDLFGQQEISAFRPSVVRNTAFIEGLRGKKLRVIEELADDADDMALVGAKDLEAALAALPRPAKPAAKPAAAKK